MSFNYGPPPTAASPKGLIVGGSISGLGDSITAQGGYFPVGTSLAGVPAWTASTPYVVGALVRNGGLIYRCTAAGTSAGSGGPAGQAQSGIVDSAAAWAYTPYVINRSNTSFLHWVEVFSGGALKWTMSQGYAGITGALIKAIVVAGGAGYAQGEAATWANGAKGYVNVGPGGVVASVTIANPGAASVTPFGDPVITTAGGSGLAVSNVAAGSGTFGVGGCLTQDMVARLPDCTASSVDIFVVHGGTNDLGASKSFAAISANLKSCYETLAGAGKRVIAMPITPRATSLALTTPQLQTMIRINRWIRAYCRREAWANPGQFIVGLADPTRYWTDGTLSLNRSTGVSLASNGAMTQDGLHPSPRGAQYNALAILAAAQGLGFGASPTPYARVASQTDGYHRTQNPGGNYLEGQPWTAGTAVQVGDLCSNAGGVYICAQAGTTAGSGGPSGTSSGQADNTAVWNYIRNSGASVFASGTKAVPVSSGGYVLTGVTDKGWTLYNSAGRASTGTIVGALETPWSDGQAGQRQSLVFNFSAGTNTEQWQLYCANNATWAATDYGNLGILQADLGVTPFLFEVEMEVSNVASVTQISTIVHDNTSGYGYRVETGFGAFPGGASSLTHMNSAGEMATIPNGGRMLLRSEPFILPASPVVLSALTVGINFGFDPTTAPASLTARINYAALRKYGVA